MFTQDEMMSKFRKLTGEIQALGDSIDDSEVSSLRDEIDGLKYTLDGIESTIQDWSVNVLALRNQVDDLMDDVEKCFILGTPEKPITYTADEMNARVNRMVANQDNLVYLKGELLQNPEAFWLTLSQCIIRRPWDCKALIAWSREYQNHL